MTPTRRPRATPRYSDDDIVAALRAAAAATDNSDLSQAVYDQWRSERTDRTGVPSVAHLQDVIKTRGITWKTLLETAGVDAEGVRENTTKRSDATSADEARAHLDAFGKWATENQREWRVRDYEEWRATEAPDAPTRKTVLNSLSLGSWFDVWDILEERYPRIRRGTVAAPFTTEQKAAFVAHQKGPTPGVCTNCRSAPWTVLKSGLVCRACGKEQPWAWEAWLRSGDADN